MNKDENNKRLAAWLGVPCWHENSQTWVASPCKHCGLDPSYIASRSDIPEQSELSYWNPDYYTPEGFFALLDGLKEKAATMRTEIDTNLPTYRVRIWSVVPIVLIGLGRSSELPTALVEASLQAMEASDG